MSDAAAAMADVPATTVESVAAPVALSDATTAAPTADASSSSSETAPAAAAASVPSAPVVPRVLPHPKEYYEVPSTTTNALLPRYTPEQLATIAATQPESAGYVPVIKTFLVNPFREPKLPLAVPPAGSGLPSPEPEVEAAAAAPADPDAPAAKRARTEHDPNAPASSSCRLHEHGPRGDEFDTEEAAAASRRCKRAQGDFKGLKEKKEACELY